jgi:DNA polymerase alpha subunit B
MSRHLLSQRSFYPLYPPDESVHLDVERWTDFAQMGCTPHILVLPSDLRYFIKDVDGTVVVNPEHLTKGHSGGTYARIQVDLPAEIGDGIEIGSPIADFVIGEILKI